MTLSRPTASHRSKGSLSVGRRGHPCSPGSARSRGPDTSLPEGAYDFGEDRRLRLEQRTDGDRTAVPDVRCPACGRRPGVQALDPALRAAIALAHIAEGVAGLRRVGRVDLGGRDAETLLQDRPESHAWRSARRSADSIEQLQEGKMSRGNPAVQEQLLWSPRLTRRSGPRRSRCGATSRVLYVYHPLGDTAWLACGFLAARCWAIMDSRAT